MTDIPKRAPFQQSVSTGLLIAALKRLGYGETLSYQALSDIAGERIDGTSQTLRTARHRVEEDFEIVVECIPGVGVQRLNDAEIVESGADGLRRIRRKAQRTGRRVMTAAFDKLTMAERQRQAAISAVAAVVAHETKPKAIERIAAGLSPNRLEIGIAETLEFFGLKKGNDNGN